MQKKGKREGKGKENKGGNIPMAKPSSVNTRGSFPRFLVFLFNLSFIMRIFEHLSKRDLG